METIVWLGFVLAALPATGEVIFTKPGYGVKVDLSCTIFHTDKDQVWYHDKKQIFYTNSKTGAPRKGPAAVHTRSRVLHNGKLSISSVMREDAGEFTCEVDKKSEKHTLLVVSVSATSPDEFQVGGTARLDCEVKGVEQGLTVKWKSPDGGTHEGTHELKPVALSHAGTWTCTVSYNSQTHNEQLVVKVKEPPPPTTPTTTQGSKSNPKRPSCPNCDGPTSWFGQLSWWMWTAIGGGCLFVVLLVVFVIVLCKRIRRNKRMKKRQLRPKQYCQCNRPTAARKPQQGRKKGKPSALPLQPA